MHQNQLYKHKDSHPRRLSSNQADSQPHSAPYHHPPNNQPNPQADSCPNPNHNLPEIHLTNKTLQYHQHAINSSTQYTTRHHHKYAGHPDRQQSSPQAKPRTNCTINAVARFLCNDSTNPIYQPLIYCLCSQSYCHPERASAKQRQNLSPSHSSSQRNNQFSDALLSHLRYRNPPHPDDNINSPEIYPHHKHHFPPTSRRITNSSPNPNHSKQASPPHNIT